VLNRWIGIFSAIGLLVVHALLIYRDVLPGWTAGDPPDADSALTAGERRVTQMSIFDARGRRIGQSWTVAQMAGVTLSVRSWTVLAPIELPNGLSTPPARIETELGYDQQMRLDHLAMRLLGLNTSVALKGEFVPPDMFPCTWQAGDMRGQFLLNADATRALGDAIRPFDRLPGLYVGRTWRVKLFNPLAEALPGFAGAGMSGSAVLVTVAGRETIDHHGEPVSCFRVEADRATAWVDASGRVLRQVVELPLLGRLTLIDEPYNEDARREAVEPQPRGAAQP
jgi:hypothetical protein